MSDNTRLDADNTVLVRFGVSEKTEHGYLIKRLFPQDIQIEELEDGNFEIWISEIEAIKDTRPDDKLDRVRDEIAKLEIGTGDHDHSSDKAIDRTVFEALAIIDRIAGE